MKKYILIILVILSTSIFGQESIVTDRPDQTESALTVPLGAWQIESGFLYEWSGSTNHKAHLFALPTTLFRYGVLKNLELRFQANYFGFKSNGPTLSGFGDFSAGLKTHLYNNGGTDIAFLANVSFPSGSDHFRNRKATYTGLISISHSLSDNLSLGYNIGLNVDEHNNANMIYSMATSFPLTDNLSAFVEIFGRWESFIASQVNFDFGFTYLLNNNFQLDASFGKGFNNDMNFLSMGISWRILPN